MEVFSLSFAMFFTILLAIVLTFDVMSIVKSMKTKQSFTKNVLGEVVLLYLTCLFWAIYLTSY